MYRGSAFCSMAIHVGVPVVIIMCSVTFDSLLLLRLLGSVLIELGEESSNQTQNGLEHPTALHSSCAEATHLASLVRFVLAGS